MTWELVYRGSGFRVLCALFQHRWRLYTPFPRSEQCWVCGAWKRDARRFCIYCLGDADSRGKCNNDECIGAEAQP